MSDLDRLTREFYNGTAEMDWRAWAEEMLALHAKSEGQPAHESATRVLHECDVNGEDDQFTLDLRVIAEFVLAQTAPTYSDPNP